eukprot:CAMPEP_0181224932 /NCGR_PEP_ID=MMETSP1096-20121128/31407_1 /TAXON_ID=156174 ORGANISM="Chrysochromulina ericina, Strain CCMP281" /NCGR_SAMPLE_ID=MMETSP1096 /ASSEMBLY_ACC=CAM_ASM_000453 /LENGTH=101 /DNA_ID=CAMNT_0023318081 /DNA_START=91 /DNA_END=396 /DNA_ORIENTATION=+
MTQMRCGNHRRAPTASATLAPTSDYSTAVPSRSTRAEVSVRVTVSQVTAATHTPRLTPKCEERRTQQKYMRLEPWMNAGKIVSPPPPGSIDVATTFQGSYF